MNIIGALRTLIGKEEEVPQYPSPDRYAQRQREKAVSKKQHAVAQNNAMDDWLEKVRREEEKARQRQAEEERRAALEFNRLRYLAELAEVAGTERRYYNEPPKAMREIDMVDQIVEGYTDVRTNEEIVVVRDGRKFRRYVSPDGQRYLEPFPQITGTQQPSNNVKATIHKAGHFPISWMMEAFETAEQSEKNITIQLEKEGVVVIGQEGDSYETHTLPWAMMEKAEVNPIILGIQTVEKHLSTLGRLKERVKKVAA